MKILQVHNAYQHSGGEDAVVEAEQGLLRAHGHTVYNYLRHNDELKGGSWLAGLGAAGNAVWSRRAAQEIGRLCEDFGPDVIHVHNTFPLISPAFFHMVNRRGIPLVQTLHNFRLLCPQAMLLREGRICQDCIGKLPWRAVTRSCYRDSAAQSAVVTGMLGLHRLLATYRQQVTQFIVLNAFCRDKFIAGGLPAERLAIKPHFAGEVSQTQRSGRSGALFVGRLAPEKGLETLAQALHECRGIQLRIAGGGPLQSWAQKTFGRACLGAQSRSEVQGLLQGAAFLVAPSICFETFGMTIIEAYACSTPVIASRHGAYAELVREGVTGLLFEPGNARDLADKMNWACSHPAQMRRMGAAARQEYEARYTPQKNYQLLMDIYEHVIRIKRRSEPAR